MTKELEFLSHRVVRGKLDRREFLGRAAALGISATFANSLLSTAAEPELGARNQWTTSGCRVDSIRSTSPALQPS